ncbi:hypothetical protein B0H11DRAFT_2289560 [Mycena galericulata]|nr:hypothetical protein B0H11DRAFT_1887556 [Mycena galericulata]KAJ7449380.1 hypothetical protein B0H11DRAFT_2289560 [Mycena galericulata]
MSKPDGSQQHQYQRHPKFYFQDGSAVFQLWYMGRPGVLYKLHHSFLGSRSAFFDTLFSLPRGPDVDPAVRSEGQSDANPIVLPTDLNQYDFDHLLCYIYTGPSTHPKTDDFLVSVLKLSTFFQMEDGIAHAVQELTFKGENFHPALQFELARRYRVDHWIEPAFRRLIKLPITELSMIHMDQIGRAGYFWLVQTQAKIEKHRKEFTFNTPRIITGPECNRPGTCEYTFTCEWNGNVPKLIHHPDFPISCVELLDLLKETEIDDLCEPCRKLTVSWIWGTGNVTREETFVDEAVAALMALQTDEPIRAALRNTIVQPTPSSASASDSPIST